MPAGAAPSTACSRQRSRRCSARAPCCRASPAAIGPCIGQPSYEVGPEFRDRFIAADAGNDAVLRALAATRAGHFHFDLPGYVAIAWRAPASRKSSGCGRDTCAESDVFFSYRRRTLEGGKDYGRNISLIALED